MTHDEHWKERFHEYMAFIEEKGRCPSKHYPEERMLHTWWKHSRKLLNMGTLKTDRVDDFKKLIALAESHRHINQYR